VVELIWLVRGETNIKYLVDRNVRIWNERPFQNYLRKNNLEDEFPKYSEVRKEKMTWFIESIKEKDANDPFVQKR
jgi:thymidylate synthase